MVLLQGPPIFSRPALYEIADEYQCLAVDLRGVAVDCACSAAEIASNDVGVRADRQIALPIVV